MKDNIVLIGMPGCGKSTLGVVLAKSTNRNFVDVDLLIQQKAGKKLHKIIEDEGLEYFSELENSVGASVEAENSVIATGGSIIFSTLSGMVFFKERPSTAQFFGVAACFVGTLLFL